jgi:hypothetical protein
MWKRGHLLDVPRCGGQRPLELRVRRRDRAHASRGVLASECRPPRGDVNGLAQAGEPVAREEEKQRHQLVRGLET